MMTETVIITGSDITVSHQDERPDPKRRRPTQTTARPTQDHRSLEEMMGVNPFWSAEANAAAESSGGTPKQLARQYRRDRKDETNGNR